MKTVFLFFFVIFFEYSGLSQVWTSVHSAEFTNLSQFHWEDGNFPETLRLQHFRLNPFDQSLWGFSKNRIYRLDVDGALTIWDETNTVFAVEAQRYNDIRFTASATYVVTPFTGVFKYNGSSWSTVSTMDKGLSLYAELDTIWVARLDEPFLKIYNSTVYSNNIEVPRRIRTSNGDFYFSSSVPNGTISLGQFAGYYIFTTANDSFYLDYKNHDFKFTPTGDTLFTSGNLGFSIAVDGQFVDTITKYNTTNMPDLAITEFEFDQNHNIWAVFSNFLTAPQPQKIGFLDRTTNVWTHIYDANNSPIDFTRVSMELDSIGNVWVASRNQLHVLSFNNPPSWLGVKDEVSNQEPLIVYPNPFSDYLKLENWKQLNMILIRDVYGKIVAAKKPDYHMNIDLSPGIYFIEFYGENDKFLGSQKITSK
jgi:Secretion system C-terminal sorting domain